MKRLFILTALLFVVTFVSAQDTYRPVGRINDYAEVINSADERLLEERLRNFEATTEIEIAVLTVSTTNGEPIEDFALRHAREWGVGKASSDTGVLLTVSINDRYWRIDTGYGMEGILTDLQANRIGERKLVPEFRRGDYSAGIILAIEALVSEIGEMSMEDRAAIAAAEAEARRQAVSNFFSFLWKFLLFVGVLFGFWRLVKHRQRVLEERKARQIRKAEIEKHMASVSGFMPMNNFSHLPSYSNYESAVSRAKAWKPVDYSKNEVFEIANRYRQVRKFLGLLEGEFSKLREAKTKIPALENLISQLEVKLVQDINKIPKNVPKRYVPKKTSYSHLFRSYDPNKWNYSDTIDYLNNLENWSSTLQRAVQQAQIAHHEYLHYLSSWDNKRKTMLNCKYPEISAAAVNLSAVKSDRTVTPVNNLWDEYQKLVAAEEARLRAIEQQKQEAARKKRQEEEEEERRRRRRRSSSYSSGSGYSSSSSRSSRSGFGGFGGGGFGGGGAGGRW